MLRELFSLGIREHTLSLTVRNRETADAMPTHSHFYPDVMVSIPVRKNLKNEAFEPEAVVIAYRIPTHVLQRYPCETC